MQDNEFYSWWKVQGILFLKSQSLKYTNSIKLVSSTQNKDVWKNSACHFTSSSSFRSQNYPKFLLVVFYGKVNHICVYIRTHFTYKIDTVTPIVQSIRIALSKKRSNRPFVITDFVLSADMQTYINLVKILM